MLVYMDDMYSQTIRVNSQKYLQFSDISVFLEI